MRRYAISNAIVLLCIFTCANISVGVQPTTSNSYWPTIRGENWDGVSKETGIADHWPPKGPPVLWTKELGQGYSAFIAWGNSVATQYQNLGGQYVVCYDADTGATRWQYRYGWPYDPAGVYPGPRSTPVYSDGFIYFTSPTGLLGCLNADSGRLIWSIELEKAFGVKVPGFGYSCSPIVVGDSIFLPIGAADASVVAIEKRTGQIKWRGATPKAGRLNTTNKSESIASYCSVYPIEVSGRSYVTAFLQNSIVCHDRASGELIWSYDLSSGYDEHSAWPIFQDPFLWMSGPFQRGSELLEITGDVTQPIRLVRKSALMSNDIFSSVLYDNALFGFDLQEAQAKNHRTSRGVFRCIDFRSGEVLWSVGTGRLQRSAFSTRGESESTRIATTESLVPDIGHATVLVADGKLILMNDLGELILAKASREAFVELGRTSILSGEICWTQPALHGQRLYVRNQSRAVCVFVGDPAALSPKLLERSKTTSELPRGKFQDLASQLLGIEPEYLFDLPSLPSLWNWYLYCVFWIFLGSWAFVELLSGAIRLLSGSTSDSVLLNFKKRAQTKKWLFWKFAFLAGAFGTTLLSHWTQQFTFTWPVCLYIAWQVAIANTSWRSTSRTKSVRLKSAVAFLFLLTTCLAYFLLCRRLSLVFQTVFLTGFVAALPFNLAEHHPYFHQRKSSLYRLIFAVLGFSAYYWASIAFLCWRSG